MAIRLDPCYRAFRRYVSLNSQGESKVKNHYESYWQRSNIYNEPDPLTKFRIGALWRFLDKSRIEVNSLLDIGCGEGDLVSAALARGQSAVGIDISETAIERARARHPGANFLVHAIEDQPWPVESNAFDVVSSFEVIEHLIHPASLLQGAYSALRDGGLLTISTPYHGKIKNLALTMMHFDKHFAVEGDHIRFFTDVALRKLCESNGFEVLGLQHLGRTWGIWANSIVWARKR